MKDITAAQPSYFKYSIRILLFCTILFHSMLLFTCYEDVQVKLQVYHRSMVVSNLGVGPKGLQDKTEVFIT